jgi:hypothetical protein
MLYLLVSFIPINNLYMFQAGLLLIIKRHYFVYTAIGMCNAFMSASILLAASRHKRTTYTHCCMYVQNRIS